MGLELPSIGSYIAGGLCMFVGVVVPLVMMVYRNKHEFKLT